MAQDEKMLDLVKAAERALSTLHSVAAERRRIGPIATHAQSRAWELSTALKALSAAPAQPAAVEGAALSASDRACYEYPGEDQAALRAAFVAGACFVADNPPSTTALDEGAAGEPVAWRYRFLGNSETDAAAWAEGHWAVTIHPRSSCTLYEVKPLYTHPSPTPAACISESALSHLIAEGDVRYVNENDVPTSAEDNRAWASFIAKHVLRHVTPAADDALRVAVEKALEPFERMWAEHGDLPPTDDRYAWGFNRADLYWGDFRRAAEALAALKSEG